MNNVDKESEYFDKKQNIYNNTTLTKEQKLIQRTALFVEYCNVRMLAEDPRGNQNPLFKELCSLMVDLTDAMWTYKDNNIPDDIVENIRKCTHTVTKMWDDSSMMKRLLTMFSKPLFDEI